MQKKWSDGLADTNAEMQESLDRGEQQIFASYGMLGSILGFGLIGYILDRWTGQRPVFLVSSLIAGIGVGFYVLIRTARGPRR